MAGVGLVLGDAVEVDDAVAEVDAVAGDADAALDEDRGRGFGGGLRKTMMSPRLDVAVVDEGSPVGGRGEGDAIDQDVVADEEGLLHGGGGDLEVLEDEGHDEEADGEDGADGGEGLECGLAVFVLGGGGGGWCGLFFGGGGGVGQDGSPRGVVCRG